MHASWFLVLVVLTACAAPRIGSGAAPARDAGSDLHDTGWRTIGRSLEDRPILARTLGRGPRRVLWVGGIHGNERESAWTTRELPAAFLAEPGLADRVTLTLVEDLNPDGSARARRGNARGVDLNRNWPARNFVPSATNGPGPLSEPEAQAFHELVLQAQPELVIVAHAFGGRFFINFDGPARPLAERFAALSGYPVVESREIHGTPGSLGSWIGIDRRTPILTLEHRKGADPADCWERTRAAILAVIAPPS
jgi:hypothetical protein